MSFILTEEIKLVCIQDSYIEYVVVGENASTIDVRHPSIHQLHHEHSTVFLMSPHAMNKKIMILRNQRRHKKNMKNKRKTIKMNNTYRVCCLGTSGYMAWKSAKL